MNAVHVDNLVHAYGDRRALDGVTFSVPEGQIFGLLGPNGGGKTTLFRILSTYFPPTSGRAEIFGRDVTRDLTEVRRSIGVVFQSPSVDNKLSVYENLLHQGHLYGLRGSALRGRIEEMLSRVGLSDRAKERVEKLSGGQKRRVELAKGFLHQPKLLLLDEPSTGLDPGGRRDVWDYLRSLAGVTVLVTTHLMEEAERCHRLAILDKGRLVAEGTPDALRSEIGGDVIIVRPKNSEAFARGYREKFGDEAKVVDGTVRMTRSNGAEFVPKLVAAFPDDIEQVTVAKPTLEDVFIRHTGHRFWEEGGE
jgi:ABC-2 type transport system ATP-binding protein